MKYLLTLFCVLLFTMPTFAYIDDIEYTEKDFLVAMMYMYKEKLPIKAANGITLVDILISNNNFKFIHVLSDEYAEEMSHYTKAEMKSMFYPHACQNDNDDADTWLWLVYNNGFSVTMSYRDRKGEHIMDMTYSPSDCNIYRKTSKYIKW